MESKSKETALSDRSVYDSHVMKRRDGSYYLLEDDATPAFDDEDVEKVYVGVTLQ